MFRSTRSAAAVLTFCIALSAISPMLASSSALTRDELQLRGGTGKACLCPVISCIKLNPNVDSKGGAGCTASAQACTACMNSANNEDFYTPIAMCGQNNCTGAGKQSPNNTKDCTGDIGSGTCQLASGSNPPFKFTCGSLVDTNTGCLPDNIVAYQNQGQ
jgi:hypothetical protein